MFRISYPVGDISKKIGLRWNYKPDIKIVQCLLNEHLKSSKVRSGRFHLPLREDGIMGSETKAAIEYFQVNCVKLAHYDSVVHPKGPTFKKLTDAVPTARLIQIWNNAIASVIGVDATHSAKIAKQATLAGTLIPKPELAASQASASTRQFDSADAKKH